MLFIDDWILGRICLRPPRNFIWARKPLATRLSFQVCFGHTAPVWTWNGECVYELVAKYVFFILWASKMPPPLLILCILLGITCVAIWYLYAFRCFFLFCYSNALSMSVYIWSLSQVHNSQWWLVRARNSMSQPPFHTSTGLSWPKFTPLQRTILPMCKCASWVKLFGYRWVDQGHRWLLITPFYIFNAYMFRYFFSSELWLSSRDSLDCWYSPFPLSLIHRVIAF